MKVAQRVKGKGTGVWERVRRTGDVDLACDVG